MRAAPAVWPYARVMSGTFDWKPELADDRFVFDRESISPDFEPVPDTVLPIVVGAHPRAEICDRPLATRLARVIRDWQERELDAGDRVLTPLVCTDLWFLNDRELMRQPSVAIGDPGINAATAYYAARLPKAFVVDDVCAVQLDAEFLEPSVALWGPEWRGTEAAVDAFLQRYLHAFLRAVH